MLSSNLLLTEKNHMKSLKTLLSTARNKKAAIFEHVDPSPSVFRLFHGLSDGLPDLYVEQLGPDVLFVHSLDTDYETMDWEEMATATNTKSIYLKRARSGKEKSAADLVYGPPQPHVTGEENGVSYELRPAEGYSFGLFTDQRKNRQTILSTVKPGQTVLNTFAYTCAFSVCAAMAGATVTSLDLSKPYLDWGRDNFRLNNIDPDEHEFIFGDVFDWLKRFAKKEKKWDLVILDPPTFSRTKQGATFQVEKQYSELLSLALAITAPGGRILCSQNKHTFTKEAFEKTLHTCLQEQVGNAFTLQYSSLPPEFSTSSTQAPASHSFWIALHSS